MRARVLFSLVGALIAAVTLASASGAATAKTQKVARIDVSTRAAVIHYLRSIHVNAKGAVIQRGVLNYAGARCPGTAWTCASTRHTVVQIAKRGGQNRFVCRSSRCSVVQFSGISSGRYTVRRQLTSAAAAKKGNAAICINPTSGICTINQSGTGPNVAVVYQNSGKKSGLSQNVSYSASITQQATGATGGNTACVSQVISLDASATSGSGSVTVSLNGHQSLTIKQDVAGSGANSAQYAATSSGTCDTSHVLAQAQTLTSQVDAPKGVTQSENAAQVACPDGNVTPDYANLCLDIEQNQGVVGHGVASGANNATVTQTNTLSAIADSRAGPINQAQSTVNGGLLGTINQDSSGVSTASVTQTEKQCEDAAKGGLGNVCHTNDADAAEAPASLTQVQHGPVRKGLGTATQTGNDADSFTITQASQQDTDQGPGSTQTNTVQGDCNTSGNCTVSQNTTVDGQTSQSTQSGNSVSSTTTCSGSTCTPSGPPTPIIDSGPAASTTSTDATFTFHDTDTTATFLCQLDSSGYTPCSSPQSYSDLSVGSHTFYVEATDPYNNTSAPATYPWTITTTSSELITNGSFEADTFDYNGTFDLGSSNPLTGWTTLTSGLYPWGLPYPNTYNAGPTPYGNQWVIVGNECDQGTSWIEQTINTTVGQSYTLSFALASEEGGSGAQVVVSFPSGSSTASQTFTAPPIVANFWDTWATSSMDFQADSTSVTIRFTSVPVSVSEGCDAGIDNVSVTAAAIIG